MNVNEMTIDDIRDELARRGGWRQAEISDGVGGPNDWSRRVADFNKIPSYQMVTTHPIPATLDEAAKLPPNWFVQVWHRTSGTWSVLADLEVSPYKRVFADGDTELLARFRLRLACTLADEGKTQ